MTTLLLRLARELRVALDNAFEGQGLTSQQAGLLIHVFGGESSPKELATLLGTDTAGMTRMLDRLERKGLLLRDGNPSDRRAICVVLTDDAKSLVPDLPRLFEAVASRLVGDLDPTELQTLLQTLLANLRAGTARP